MRGPAAQVITGCGASLPPFGRRVMFSWMNHRTAVSLLAVCAGCLAGCGGTAPSRSHSDKAESVKRINTAFPHWFDAAFKEFNDCPVRLPFDQNCLAALVAPRPGTVPKTGTVPTPG